MAEPDMPIVDCQCHLFTPGTLARLRTRVEDPRLIRKDGVDIVTMGNWPRRIDQTHTDVDQLLGTMETSGVTRTALSPNDPGPEWFGIDAEEVARESNDFIAATVETHSDRLFGIGVLPLPDIEPARREMNRGVRELGLRGFLLYSNICGRYPDTLGLEPVFREAVDLDIPLIIHPAKPVWDEPMADVEMIAAVGNMFEDTIALLRLILSGVIDRHPALKLVCPHLGGTLPFVFGRLEHQINVLGRGPQNLALPPLEYLRRVYFDIVSPQPSAMRLLLDLAGPERLLFGSDYPWVQPALMLETFNSLELSPPDRQAILHRNATHLFNLNVQPASNP
jgi:predicted TIM-barrel fold metal-dependent hydrolase